MGTAQGKHGMGSVPFAITQADRIPSRRYHDPEFFALERERLWPRVWQMACRLEEIPKRGDFVVYENLDQSVIVLRIDENTIKAFHNACRHRGAKLLDDRGCRPNGIVCPFHGWSWDIEGTNTFVLAENLFGKGNLDETDLRLRACRVETWGGCAFINLDDNAPPLRESIKPFADMLDPWEVDDLRVEWWLAARLPVNWKLAMEAFMEGYHVMATHPQLLPPGVPRGRGAVYAETGDMMKGTRYATFATDSPPMTSVDSQPFIDMNIHFMRVLNEGMAGMTHEKDVRIAERLRDLELPSDPIEATLHWRRKLNEAIVQSHKDDGMQKMPDLNAIDDNHLDESVNFCFPHYFLLPTYSSASSYRIRPLGPEETLFELWSLTRYPPGEEPPRVETPTPMAHDDPRWPPIPKQDFSNLPRQQRGLHTSGFEFMRLSEQVEGLISNYQRLIDGYLAGLDDDKLLAAAQNASGPIDLPIADMEF